MRSLMFAVLVFAFVGTAQAQYGPSTHAMSDITIAPYGTTRIYNYSNGNQTYYNNQGYYGRSYYTGGGSRSIYDRSGQYMGRSQPYGNGYRYVPTAPIIHLHNMPRPTYHR